MSAKLRLTAWFTLMMLLLCAATLTFVFVVNGAAVADDPQSQLIDRVDKNARDVEFENGRFEWEDLKFYRRGVSCWVCDENGAFLQGVRPDGLPELPPEDGALRTVSGGDGQYYMYDVYVDMDVTGLWVRGVISTGSRSGVMHTINILTAVLLPCLLVVTVAGGWGIAHLTFRPMEQIIGAADAINDDRDLSARIGLKKGPIEMRRLSRSFDSLFARLEKSFHAERQFTSDASHELRTPITVILAECDRARRKCETKEDFLQSIGVIEEQGQHMSRLVQELLGLTRLQQGTTRYPLQRADVSGFVTACCEEFLPADDRGITLTTDIQPEVQATFNPSLLQRAVYNLLQNAYKYGKPGGHITVTLREAGHGAALSVADDGIGIAPEDQEKIWQRFWQADPSRGEDGGSGLGLSMVQEIAAFHGGRATVDSTPGQGSTFTITLPKR